MKKIILSCLLLISIAVSALPLSSCSTGKYGDSLKSWKNTYTTTTTKESLSI